MEWQTKISPTLSEIDITHHYKILSIGSCFAENIGQKFLRYGFPANVNPFGILFNPISIANCLETILNNSFISENDIIYHDHLWHSLLHHGIFSRDTKEKCLEDCNISIQQSHEFIKGIDILILTFGTAFGYLRDNLVVANCHKIPNKEFIKKRFSIEEITLLYKALIDNLLSINPDLKIIFTVSPVRHWKDGYRENQLSKSILHLSIDKIQTLYPSSIDYFPAYEIVMDELRDYRFYSEDLLHVSQPAIDYIWEKFSDTYFSIGTKDIIQEVEKYRKLEEHRPLKQNSISLHLEKINTVKSQISRKYPFINFF